MLRILQALENPSICIGKLCLVSWQEFCAVEISHSFPHGSKMGEGFAVRVCLGVVTEISVKDRAGRISVDCVASMRSIHNPMPQRWRSFDFGKVTRKFDNSSDKPAGEKAILTNLIPVRDEHCLSNHILNISDSAALRKHLLEAFRNASRPR